MLREQGDPRIADWLKKKMDKYASHDMQNEMLKVMAMAFLREIAASLADSRFFTIMCDECTDVANTEQPVIYIRWVASDFLEVTEDVIGMHKVDNTSSAEIVRAIKDALLRVNLPMAKCRGQCYDGASNMSGVRRGVAAQLKEIQPRALYLHCHGHALNLAACDAVKAVQ